MAESDLNKKKLYLKKIIIQIHHPLLYIRVFIGTAMQLCNAQLQMLNTDLGSGRGRGLASPPPSPHRGPSSYSD